MSKIWLTRGELKGIIREMVSMLDEGPTRPLGSAGLRLRHAATGRGGPRSTMNDDRPLVETMTCEGCGMSMDECDCVHEAKHRKGSRKKNPWAICTSSVGRKDKDKYERCVMHVKGEK